MRFIRTSKRPGVTTVESAIVMSTFLILVLGILDIGIATYRYNLLSEAARRLAREAIVCGEEASSEGLAWGPNPVSDTVAGNTQAADFIRPLLVGCDPSKVTIKLSWPDGGNESNQRVRIVLGYQHTSLTTLLGFDEINLSAVSTMRIVH